MKKNNRLILAYVTLFTFSYIAMSLSVGLMTPLLSESGYSSSQIGFFFSAGALAGVFSQIIVGYIADKHSKLRFFVILSGLIFMIGNAYIFIYPKPIFLLFLIGMFMSAGGRIFIGLLDTWVLEVNEFMRGKYGFVRAFGSVGWAIGLGIFARFVTIYGYIAVSVMIVVFMILTLLVGMTIPDAEKKSSDKIKVADLIKLVNPEYILWIIVFFLIFCEIVAEDMILVFKMIELGANINQIALRASLQALFELPLFFMGGWLIDKFTSKKIVIFALCFLLLKVMFYAYTSSITMMLIGTGFQIVTYPLIILTSKYLLYEASPTNLKITGQLFGAAIFGSVAGTIAPALFGSLAENLGITNSIFCLGGFVLVSIMISIIGILKMAR